MKQRVGNKYNQNFFWLLRKTKRKKRKKRSKRKKRKKIVLIRTRPNFFAKKFSFKFSPIFASIYSVNQHGLRSVYKTTTMIKYKIDKMEIDDVIIVNTPAAADAVLALGKLSLKDEAGNVAKDPLIRDVIGKRKVAYAAGTANVNTIDLSTLGLQNKALYKIGISLSNVIEPTGQVRAERMYIVSSDSSATIDEIGAEFVTRINNDLDAGVTASYNSGTKVLKLTVQSVNYGAITATNNFDVYGPSIAFVDAIPYVAPSGTPADAAQYVPAASTLVSQTANYTKWLIRERKLIRHNAVSGLSVYKISNILVFADSLGGSYAAYETALDAALAGTTATAGAYTGTPTI